MPLSDSERKHRQRLREAGYALKPCPDDVTNKECLAWAESVWRRQAELMPRPQRRPVPK